MARLVKHERTSPYVLKKDEIEDTVFICACGLSKNKPFCDRSHREARTEDDGALYVYDDEGNRVKVPTAY